MLGFKEIIAEYANLDIIDFNIHERTHLESIDRYLPFYVMSYMKEGSSSIRTNDCVYDVHEGEVVVIPPQLRHDHTMGGSRHTVFLWWHFKLTIGDHLDVMRFIREPTVFPVERREDFEHEFIDHVNLNKLDQHTLSSHIRRRASALEVMACLLDGASIVNYINASFADVPDDFIEMLHDIVREPQTWRHVNELAERYDYHPAYLSSRFRHFFGVTPGKLGRKALYRKAAVLVRSRDISLAEVAEELGFSDSSSFTRFFKSVEGLSPSSLRRRHDHGEDRVDDGS